ncbi:MAG: MMPL family transporter [Pseudomonadota bacterium]
MSWLAAWVGWVTRHAGVSMVMLLTITAASVWVAVTQFKINSDLGELIDQQTEWRTHFDHFENQFPDLVRTAVVVVRSPSLDQLEQATAKILTALHAQPDQFTAIAAPGSEAFFRDHALLYLDFAELDDMTDRLAEAQPWLTAVAEDPSLRSILQLLADGLQAAPPEQPPEGFSRVVELLAGSALTHADGGIGRISWTDELFTLDAPRYQLIYLKAQSVDGVRVSDAQIVQGLRALLAGLHLPADVEVRLAGEIALQHEEIEAAVSGVALAGWLSLALLFLVLLVGVRSVKIIVATFSMLAIGVVWTSAYAMLAVGEYNTLSLVFIVMFFGLGVDFALHFSLRFQEAINRGSAEVSGALVDSTRSVGRAISLCTLTTGIGFLGFWPTAYQGLADLGVISAGGMVVAWLLTFTYLPAFYALAGAPRAHQMDLPTSERVVGVLVRHRRTVIAVVLLLGAVAAAVASRASFDYSVLALKDPEAESMRALRELQDEGLSTDYQLFVVTQDAASVSAVAALPTVSEVRTPADVLPEAQVEKAFVLEDLQGLLYSALAPPRQLAPPSAAELRQGLLALAAQLPAPSTHSGVSAVSQARLADGLRAVTALDDAGLLAWQVAVVDNLQQELQWLSRALAVTPVTYDQLPLSVRQRLHSPDGEALVVIRPSEDIAAVQALSAFITEVRGQIPAATGRPVIEWGVGQIVIEAFLDALLFAVVGISLVLWLSLRRLRSVGMILLPLALTAVCAFAVSVLISMPLNMANILVLPLIFGLGVDNGIHVVDRYLGEGDVDHLIHSSTPRAVLLSTMTTIGAFAALSFSPHAGTASIGLLLTVSVAFLLVFTIFLLPVLLARVDQARLTGP